MYTPSRAELESLGMPGLAEQFRPSPKEGEFDPLGFFPAIPERSKRAGRDGGWFVIVRGMTTEETREALLKSGVPAERLPEGGPFDLSGMDLSGRYLRCGVFCGANFRGSNLEGVDLRNSNLKGADFREANLKDADLSGGKSHGGRSGAGISSRDRAFHPVDQSIDRQRSGR